MHWRVIDGAAEAPDAWRGDFHGLNFVLETYDVRFLDAHDLEKGNLYKLINQTTDWQRQQRYQGAFAPNDGSDHDNIEANLDGGDSPAYIAAVLEHLPRAVHVFDRFHVMKLFHHELSELRRELYREATDLWKKQVLKGTRWLLLKNPENLDDEKQESKRLKEALQLNQTLATAYYLKEDLRQFWNQTTYRKASRFLERWCERAEASGIRRLQKLANTIRGHRSGLLNWYVYPISTGPLEGTNTKLRVLQRQAYGFRDKEFFMLKIYQLHETKHALVG